MNVPALLKMVADAGFTVDVTDDGPRLVKTREDARISGRLVEALKQSRGEVVLYLSRCSVCGRDCRDAETRARLVDPVHCDRGGAKAVVTRGGLVEHDEEARCPHKN